MILKALIILGHKIERCESSPDASVILEAAEGRTLEKYDLCIA